MRLFGKAREAPPVSENLQKMRVCMTNLEKREEYLQQKYDQETVAARKYARTNKRRAMHAVKKRRTYAQQIDRISNARLTIETQIMHIEQAAINIEAIQIMSLGADTMRHQQSNMTVDDVDNIMDDIRDRMDDQDAISDALSQPLLDGFLDEDDLEAELAALEEEVSLEPVQMEPAQMPNVPNQAVLNERLNEEQAFRRLEAEMGL